jgi:hypothetical protein
MIDPLAHSPHEVTRIVWRGATMGGGRSSSADGGVLERPWRAAASLRQGVAV